MRVFFVSLILLILGISNIVFSQTLQLKSPNEAGLIWYAGKSSNITWTTTGTIPFVKLELSTDLGLSWTSIASGVNNTGTYSWSIPEDVSENCLIKISDFNNPAIGDTSDNAFTIKKPYIALSQPNGGDYLNGCTTTPIVFTHGGLNNYARIYYSVDGGEKWTLIAEPYIGSGSGSSYNWSVPTVASDRVLIRVEDYYAPAVSDVSDAFFSIGTQLASHPDRLF